MKSLFCNPFTDRVLILLVIITLSVMTVLPYNASAHHSAAAYDESKTTTITGTVSLLQWRNPHVILVVDVEDANGEIKSWPLETTGIQQLARNGWTRDIVAAGTQLSAGIHPMVQDTPGGILLWVTLPNGQRLNVRADTGNTDVPSTQPARPAMVVPQESKTANPVFVTQEDMVQLTLSERAAKSRLDFEKRREEWNALEEEIRPESLPFVETERPSAFPITDLERNVGDVPYDFTGVWRIRSSREQSNRRGGMPWHFIPVPPLTDASRESKTDIVSRRRAGDPTADPAALCYPHGLPRAMARAGNMMIIQEKNAIFTIHRLNNDYRSIFLDGRDHVDPSVRIQSYNGDSIGIWETDSLFIETVGFGEPFHFINEGIPMGPEGKIEERWYLKNDNNTLIVEYRMTDPDNWVGEWIDFKIWDRNIGGDIREANCILAEDGILAGAGGTIGGGASAATSEPEVPFSTARRLLFLLFGIGIGFGILLVLISLRNLKSSRRAS